MESDEPGLVWFRQQPSGRRRVGSAQSIRMTSLWPSLTGPTSSSAVSASSEPLMRGFANTSISTSRASWGQRCVGGSAQALFLAAARLAGQPRGSARWSEPRLSSTRILPAASAPSPSWTHRGPDPAPSALTRLTADRTARTLFGIAPPCRPAARPVSSGTNPCSSNLSHIAGQDGYQDLLSAPNGIHTRCSRRTLRCPRGRGDHLGRDEVGTVRGPHEFPSKCTERDIATATGGPQKGGNRSLRKMIGHLAEKGRRLDVQFLCDREVQG